jgi:catechol 2,3-dioxygenase-like lactoylglutathione lyase family enzyme
MEPVIDHIQITVRDMNVAVPFYDKLLPILGFDPERRVSAAIDAHELHVVEYSHPRLGFAINSPRATFRDDSIHRRKPGALHHLAFKASSRDEVDRLYSRLKEIGAVIVSEPRLYPEHGENYYAVFFKDLEGIKYEIVHEDRRPRALDPECDQLDQPSQLKGSCREDRRRRGMPKPSRRLPGGMVRASRVLPPGRRTYAGRWSRGVGARGRLHRVRFGYDSREQGQRGGPSIPRFRRPRYGALLSKGPVMRFDMMITTMRPSPRRRIRP